MRLRGYAPGCQPKEGLMNVYYGGGQYHNLISYNRPLTEKELKRYELDFINDTEVKR